ncbi:MAG: LysM peptidoglycan-binding domain-containing protein [Desulfobacteraceae bacterium]
MGESRETEMKDIVEELAEDRGRSRRSEREGLRRQEPFADGIGWRPIAIAGAVLVVLLVLGLILFTGDNEDSDPRIQMLEDRLSRIEAQLQELESAVARVSDAGSRAESLSEAVSRLESDQKTISDRLDGLSRKLDRGSGTRASTETGPAGGSKETHVVKSGETLFSIARRYEMSLDELCRLNGIKRDAVIRPGQELTIRNGGE